MSINVSKLKKNHLGKWQNPVCVELLSHAQLFVTPWTEAHQALLPMGFSRQEYRSGFPFPNPGELTHPEPESSGLAGRFFSIVPPGKPRMHESRL